MAAYDSHYLVIVLLSYEIKVLTLDEHWDLWLLECF